MSPSSIFFFYVVIIGLLSLISTTIEAQKLRTNGDTIVSLSKVFFVCYCVHSFRWFWGIVIMVMTVGLIGRLLIT
jgi:hypothetical protein